VRALVIVLALGLAASASAEDVEGAADASRDAGGACDGPAPDAAAAGPGADPDAALVGPAAAPGARARAEANAARLAAQRASPDAARLAERAASFVAALPPDAPDRVVLALHVLRTKMLLAPGEPELAASLRRIADEAAAAGAPGPRAWSHVYLAEHFLRTGDERRAAGEAERALLVPERDDTLEARIAAELALERTRPAVDGEDDAIRGLRRARVAAERLRGRVSSARFLERARPVHQRLAGRLLARAARLDAASAAATPAAPAVAAADVEALLREALDALEGLKLAELRDYFGDRCLAGLETTTPERVPGTLLLYPAVLEDRVELIVGRSGRLARLRAPIAPEALAAKARQLRGALQDPTSARHRTLAAELHAALIAPLEQAGWLGDGVQVGAGAPDALVFVPSGPLREVPIAALAAAGGGRPLIDRVAVATLPTLHVLPPVPFDARRKRLLAAGLTRAVADFSPLPYAARELDAAAARFPATRRVDQAFTQARFASAFDERPFDVVHVASHARFDAQANESFLLAWDGRMGIPALAELIGRTRHRTDRPLELLVLSACETAIGDERAVLGLAGVAVQSGARSAVASLWKVHDEATMELFTVFYRELGRPGVSRAEALRRAQRALLASERFRHPVFWSAFLLVNGWL